MAVEDVLFQRLGKVFPPGTVLFRDGEKGKEMYVIQSGKVKISKEIRGEEQTLAMLGAGEFFGEMAILNNKPRSASASVVEESKMLVIDPKTFEAMIKGNTEIAVRMIKKLAQRLQEADHQIESLMLKDSNSRVVHTLTRLADTMGKPTPAGTKVGVTVAELAGKCGLETPQVDEIIQKIVKAKLLIVEPDGITISNAEKLRKFLEYLTMKEQFGDM
ncbi:MAG TPA: Crp/Fnr family transcriptional regulator [bacterium]|nr:Crp/Fnr family transcriptional regulator [bacterium]